MCSSLDEEYTLSTFRLCHINLLASLQLSYLKKCTLVREQKKKNDPFSTKTNFVGCANLDVQSYWSLTLFHFLPFGARESPGSSPFRSHYPDPRKKQCSQRGLLPHRLQRYTRMARLLSVTRQSCPGRQYTRPSEHPKFSLRWQELSSHFPAHTRAHNTAFSDDENQLQLYWSRSPPRALARHPLPARTTTLQ